MQGSAGVYYAFFAEYFLLVGGLAASFSNDKKLQPLLGQRRPCFWRAVTLGRRNCSAKPCSRRSSYWNEHGTEPGS